MHSPATELQPPHGMRRVVDFWGAESLMREDDRAIGECKKALEMHPNFARAHFSLALIYEGRGVYDLFFRELETAMTLVRDDPKKIALLRKAYETSGTKGLGKNRSS